MKVSVVIPCRNEQRYISDCVRSLLSNGFDPEQMEILVVDGMSTDGTIEVLKELMHEFHQVKQIPNPEKITPRALNLGIENAVGEFILIASAHSSFAEGYISTLISKINELDNAIAVGGVMRTEVKNKSKISLAIRQVLSNKFGVGNAMFRIGTDLDIKVDTVPFGLYRAELLKETGGYDERLIRNHDIELSKRLLKNGGNIYLIPSAECTYYARERYMDMAKNNFRNGKWNILTVYITRNFSSLSLRHFIPLIFLFSLLLPLLAALLYTPLAFLSLISFLTYILGTVYFSMLSDRKGTTIPHLMIGFLMLHLSYGLGSLNGILILPKFAFK